MIHIVDGALVLKVDLSNQQKTTLKEFFLSRNSIFIVDDGEGMTSEIIANHWMIIGTGNKERNYLSRDRRIRTVVKGIGRFALDRLGSLTRLWTKPQHESNGYYWEIDWNQFSATDSQIEIIEK